MNECDGCWIQHRNVAGCFSSNKRRCVCICAFPLKRKLHPPLVFELPLTGSMFRQTRPSISNIDKVAVATQRQRQQQQP